VIQHQRHDTEASIASLELQDLTSIDPQPFEEEQWGEEEEEKDTRHTETAKLLSHSASASSSSSSDPADGDDDTQMSKKSKSRSPNPSRKANGDAANGHAKTTTMDGNLVQHRAKHAALDSPTAVTQRYNLMGRQSFTLDDPIHTMGSEGPEAKGFTELPEKDRRNFLLLVLLYFLQGVPMGLASGAVPFLLKSHVSYAQMGVFSLASYPYSLKLLWSPIVDAVWSPRLGRRKSWILPIQTLSGMGMLWLGGHAEEMMAKAGENNGAGIWGFTSWWFMLVFMCATQDIAVDGASHFPYLLPSSCDSRHADGNR